MNKEINEEIMKQEMNEELEGNELKKAIQQKMKSELSELQNKLRKSNENDLENDICNRFTYHEPINDQPERYRELRDHFYMIARKICELTPKSREQSLAITKLEEANFFANAAIARREIKK